MLIGVDEITDRVANPKPEGRPLGNDPVGMVNTACAETWPPIVPEVSDYLPNPSDGTRGFLVVSVAMSEDVHTIDQGRDIYIRLNDQSRPIRASLDQIKDLLDRRARARALQEQRRDQAIQRLCDLHGRDSISAIGGRALRGLWLSIGPTINTDPLVDVRSMHVPFGDHNATTSVQNGVIAIGDAGTPPTACDVFGNLTLFSEGLETIDTNIVRPREFRELSRQSKVRDRDGNVIGVNAPALVQRILVLLSVATTFYEDLGFIGMLSFRLSCIDIRSMPLFFIADDLQQTAVVLGMCFLDDTIEINRAFSTSDCSREQDHIVRSVMEEAAWAWGCTSREATDDAIIRGHQLFAGTSAW